MLERVLWQGSLLGAVSPAVDTEFGTLERMHLSDRSWVDVARGWLTGADEVFEELVDLLPWQQRTVTMFDRRLQEPRLTHWWREGSPAPEPLAVLEEARSVLS